MTSHRPASGGRGRVFGPLISRAPAGRGQARLLAAIVALTAVVLVVLGVTRGRRVAEFAPVSVIDSREPLQELPVRVAAGREAVEPAHTYDAMLDMSNLNGIVVGVDLDYITKGLPRYDIVIRSPEGGERFRERLNESYFQEGRFMLRLFARRFSPGDYNLDIEGFDAGTTEGRIIASSWFQITR